MSVHSCGGAAAGLSCAKVAIVTWFSLAASQLIRFTSLVFIVTTFIIHSNIGRLNAMRELLNKATTERATCSFISVLGRKERTVLQWGLIA